MWISTPQESHFLTAIIYRKIMYNENFQRLFIWALFIKQTTLANVEKIPNLYKIFYAHLPWFLIFLIFTDTSCIQITQYFLPVKILCISKKKKIGKHWILLLYSKYRFEFSCGAKFAGSEKRIEWEINKKSRGAIENWFSKKKKKRTWSNFEKFNRSNDNDKRVCTHCKLYSSPLNRN